MNFLTRNEEDDYHREKKTSNHSEKGEKENGTAEVLVAAWKEKGRTSLVGSNANCDH